MSKREYKLFIQDIVDETDRILRFVNRLESLDDLEKDELVLYAVLKSLENIGEATKHIPEHIKEKYPYFWKEVSGLRDIIIHHYWGIDYEIIKDIIENEVEQLKEVTQKVLENEK